MINPKDIKANGKVDILSFLEGEWVKVELWATDAVHALTVDPENHKLPGQEPPAVEPIVGDEEEHDEEEHKDEE